MKSILFAAFNEHSTAGMAELVDALVSKTNDRKIVGVRFPLPAHTFARSNLTLRTSPVHGRLQ